MKHREHMQVAREALEEAAELHAAHMDGTEPTSERSQRKLMLLIERARMALMGEMQTQGRPRVRVKRG